MCRDETAYIFIAFILYLFCISTFHIILYRIMFLSIYVFICCAYLLVAFEQLVFLLCVQSDDICCGVRFKKVMSA